MGMFVTHIFCLASTARPTCTTSKPKDKRENVCATVIFIPFILVLVRDFSTFKFGENRLEALFYYV